MERLALIEVIDHDGRVQRSFDVQAWPVRIGRALDNDLVLDDPHVAAHHISLDRPAAGEGAVALRVGQSINGVQLVAGATRRRLAAGALGDWPAGATLRAGRSLLRLRQPGEALADEVPLAGAGLTTRFGWTAAAFVLVLAATVAEVWLDNDPGAQWDKYLPALLQIGIGIPLWALLWGLGSKLFQRQFLMAAHLRVTLGFALALLVAGDLLPVAAYALSWGWLSHVRPLVVASLFCVLLTAHLRLLLPGRERLVTAGGLACCGALVVLLVAFNLRQTHRPFAETYVSTLAPLVVRLAPAVPTTTLLDDLGPLRATLEQRAREDADNNSVDSLTLGEQ